MSALRKENGESATVSARKFLDEFILILSPFLLMRCIYLTGDFSLSFSSTDMTSYDTTGLTSEEHTLKGSRDEGGGEEELHSNEELTSYSTYGGSDEL